MESKHGYGNLNNLISMKRVWMVEHMEGVGIESSPMRQVQTFFDEHGKFLARKDIATQPNDGTPAK